MAAVDQRAPAVRECTSAPGIEALTTFKINGMSPFLSAADIAQDSLQQAHAVATIAGSLFVDETSQPNHDLMRQTFEAIATLIALSVAATKGGAA